MGSGALSEDILISSTALPNFFLAVILAIWLVVGLSVYIYISFAYSQIGKKAKLKNPNLAWIPFLGPLIISSSIAKMSIYPLFLLFSPLIFLFEFSKSRPLFVFLSVLFVIISILGFVVFRTIWHWKMYKALKRPGWWALLRFLPYLGTLVDLIILGIVAWTDVK
ncbi:MAG TPA: hypothetical protein PLX15_03620 [Candidatus Woesearchaeota archaeon]|nr:hypothetical protein [Candidatus Woesearchaeota archaeon]